MVVFALTLIRHGETAHNKDNVIQGQLDVPLSQTGIRQAELLGCHLQHQQYSHVYASDLRRAMQTAESIIKQNRGFKSSLLHDRRLRERKFGAVEGKSFKFLKEAAEKANQNSGQYTPPGGETIQQVHERAVSFFQDLCQMVKERSNFEFSIDASVSRTCSNGLLQGENLNRQKRKWENGEADLVQNIENKSASNNKVCVKEILKTDIFLGSNKNEDSPGLEKGIPDIVKDMSDPTYEDNEELIGSKAQICTNDCKLKTNNAEILNKQNCQCRFNKKSDTEHFSVMFTDDDIRSQIISNSIDLPNIECPNVSLSPLVDQNFSPVFCSSNAENCDDLQQERRLSICSSSDDADGGPTLMANILVVSHGGWLRELFRYFVEELECSVPGGRKQALRISPNAGLSKFTISFEEQDGHPKITCLQIHDKQHLILPSYGQNPDNVVL